MSEIQDWDVSAANNTTAAPDGFPIGTMTVKQLDDTGREMMAVLARWHADTNGSLVSTGTGTAYEVTPNRTISAYADGLVMAFEAHLANTGAATLALTGLTAKAIRAPNDAALAGGEIAAGGKITVIFDASTDHWQLVAGAVPGTAAVSIPDGAAATPSLRFASDTNTGLYRAAEDDLRVAAGGTDSLKITNAAVSVPTGIFDLPEISPPGNPAANTARIYAQNSSGTKLAFRDDSGNETILGAVPTRQVFTSSGTWNKPAVGTVAYIQVWGGGGGGGDGGTNSSSGGGGGGGYNEEWIPLSSLASTVAVTVGTGGGQGAAGGDSSFGAHVAASGGNAGSTGSSETGAAGGAGGGVNGTPGTGHAFGQGGAAPAGGTATDGNDGGAWGGGSGGNGNPNSSGFGGDGGNSFYGGGGGGGGGTSLGGGDGGTSAKGGNGGAGQMGATNGTAGTAPGGGGGGAEEGTAGSGARGEVRVTVF